MEPKNEILIVDDDRSLVDVLGMALQDAGFTVRTAFNGKSGWESFLHRVPDLVILDLLMPELDGIQLCKLIRQNHFFRSSRGGTARYGVWIGHRSDHCRVPRRKDCSCSPGNPTWSMFYRHISTRRITPAD